MKYTHKLEGNAFSAAVGWNGGVLCPTCTNDFRAWWAFGPRRAKKNRIGILFEKATALQKHVSKALTIAAEMDGLLESFEEPAT